MSNKQYARLFKQHGAKEVAMNFVFPSPLSKKEKSETDKNLSEVLAKRRAAISEKDKIKAKLLQLHFQIEDYLKDIKFDKKRTFSFFLKSYIQSLEIKQSQLAREIAVKPSVLSQYINKHRTPPDNVMIRLELHSDSIIPASDWYLLVEKEKVNELNSNKLLRNRERYFIKKESTRHKVA